jgi:hypothetical protein
MGRERRPRLVGGDVLNHYYNASARSKMRCGCLGDEETALRRRAHGRVPILLRDFLDGLGLEARPRCVDEDVEAAELLDGSLDERPRGPGLTEVAVLRPRGENLPAFLLELGDDRRSELPGAACDECPHVRGV